MAEIEVHSSGTVVSASPSDRIVIRVPENATTGYRWAVAEVGGQLAIESNDFIAPETALPGAGGQRVVVVRPTRPGRARVSLALKRAWEAEPIERFECEVDVSGG